ncbi:MAG: glyoxalase [Sphingobacteriaceae bacterium]|jgi:uncharacterized glyoxalase superfamily protein PhnB|nr:glyoxalase [Sphingobacteriaceae bacterium]
MKHRDVGLRSGIFITFSGNCRRALTFYQSCFGGALQFETFGEELQGFAEKPVVSGSLVSDKITIYGSDLVHNEGRRVGNYISVFLLCKSAPERKRLIEKLAFDKPGNDNGQKLVEVADGFGVTWVLGL